MDDPKTPDIDWGSLAAFRAEVPPTILDLPVAFTTLYDAVAREVAPDARVLDIGANDRELERQLAARGFTGTYRSMDVSRANAHDFHALADVDETFDVVVMKEVIEHLPLPVFLGYLDDLDRIIAPGGSLVLTTPNVFSVVHWESWDMTHCQHYPYPDLYALLRSRGFDASVSRIAEPIFGFGWRLPFALLRHAYRLIHVYCFRPTDYAGTLFAVARKPSS